MQRILSVVFTVTSARAEPLAATGVGVSGNNTMLYYVHDPMCSWCWAYRPVRLLLEQNLPAPVRWRNVLGGLAQDTDQPMPVATRHMVQAHWRKIQSSLGTEFNFDFWTRCEPRRDTYKACRAVLAVTRQGTGAAEIEAQMIEAIQRAYYLDAKNPSDPAVLADLAAGLGLDRSTFERDLMSAPVEAALQRELSLCARLGARTFPSLVLEHRAALTAVKVDYVDHRTTLMEIRSALQPGSG